MPILQGSVSKLSEQSRKTACWPRPRPKRARPLNLLLHASHSPAVVWVALATVRLQEACPVIRGASRNSKMRCLACRLTKHLAEWLLR